MFPCLERLIRWLTACVFFSIQVMSCGVGIVKTSVTDNVISSRYSSAFSECWTIVWCHQVWQNRGTSWRARERPCADTWTCLSPNSWTSQWPLSHLLRLALETYGAAFGRTPVLSPLIKTDWLSGLIIKPSCPLFYCLLLSASSRNLYCLSLFYLHLFQIFSTLYSLLPNK